MSKLDDLQDSTQKLANGLMGCGCLCILVGGGIVFLLLLCV
jgi:hypothetical protein